METCRYCDSSDELELVDHLGRKDQYCWSCRFKIKNRRAPDKYDWAIHDGATCIDCSSADDLKPSRRRYGALYCWECRFHYNRERLPTQMEVDHHSGIIHGVNDGCKQCDHKIGVKHEMCKICTPSDVLSDKLAHPDKYISYEGEWPGGYVGNLLSWVIKQLTRHSYLEIAHVEVRSYIGVVYYKFEPIDFDIPFDGSHGDIEELKNIIRFVMKDGSSYTVMTTDYENETTRLLYNQPISSNAELCTGLRFVLKQQQGY